MKIADVKIGAVYRLSDKLGEVQGINEAIDAGNMLEFRADIEHGKDKRPYCCVDIDESGIVWVAPMSTNVKKYHEIDEQIKSKHRFNNKLVFTRLKHRDGVILLQNVMPIIPEYIEDNYYKNIRQPITINHQTLSITLVKFKRLMEQQRRGVKLIYNDTDRLKSVMLANDFRIFSDLSNAERRNVIAKYYETDILKANASWSNETQIINYEREVSEISKKLFMRHDIRFNPHTMERIQQITYQFGNTRYSTFKGQKKFYVTCDTAQKTLLIAKALDKQEIPYRGVINEDNSGQIQILSKDVGHVRRLLQEPLGLPKTLGNISYLTSRGGSCVAFSGTFKCDTILRFANALSKSHQRFRIEMDAGGNGKLICLSKDVDSIRKVLNAELASMRKERQHRNLVPKSISLTP